MIKTPRSEEKKPAVPMLSLNDAKAVVEVGHPEIWGCVLDLTPKFDMFGLGSSPTRQGLAPKCSRGRAQS